MLLRAGASIRELNAVRKHLSAIAGGQLAKWAAPAQVISLIVSDVIGDPIDFIGSGPTAPDTTSFSDAYSILEKYGLDVPDAVRERIKARRARTNSGDAEVRRSGVQECQQPHHREQPLVN